MKLINSSRERSLLGLVIKFLVIDFYCSRIVHLVTAQSIISTNEGHSVVVPRIDTDIDTLLTKLKSELAKVGCKYLFTTIVLCLEFTRILDCYSYYFLSCPSS